MVAAAGTVCLCGAARVDGVAGAGAGAGDDSAVRDAERECVCRESAGVEVKRSRVRVASCVPGRKHRDGTGTHRPASTAQAQSIDLGPGNDGRQCGEESSVHVLASRIHGRKKKGG